MRGWTVFIAVTDKTISQHTKVFAVKHSPVALGQRFCFSIHSYSWSILHPVNNTHIHTRIQNKTNRTIIRSPFDCHISHKANDNNKLSYLVQGLISSSINTDIQTHSCMRMFTMFAFMNTLSLFHIYNVLSHKKKYYFVDSKRKKQMHRPTCFANVINLCILHICLYIYLVQRWSMADFGLRIVRLVDSIASLSTLVMQCKQILQFSFRLQNVHPSKTIPTIHSICTFHSIMNWWNSVQLSYSYEIIQLYDA